MKRLVLLTFAGIIASCSPKIYPSHEYVQTDSVRVEIRERIDTQIVEVEIEKEVEKIVTPRDSSHLENTYCTSDAFVDSLGFLHHSLETKPKKIKKEVYVPATDTTTTKASKTEDVTTITIEVEKKLSWWQKARLNSFWPMLVAVIGLLAWTFRKYIVKLIKLFF